MVKCVSGQKWTDEVNELELYFINYYTTDWINVLHQNGFSYCDCLWGNEKRNQGCVVDYFSSYTDFLKQKYVIMQLFLYHLIYILSSNQVISFMCSFFTITGLRSTTKILQTKTKWLFCTAVRQTNNNNNHLFTYSVVVCLFPMKFDHFTRSVSFYFPDSASVC